VSVLSTNPDEVYTEVVARMQLIVPDFEPRGLTEHLCRTFASAAAEINGNLEARLAEEVRQSQGDLLGIPMQDGVPAASTITVQAVDTVGHTLDAGTRVWIGGSPGDAIECVTVADLVIPATEDEGTVAIETVEPGAAFNGVDGDVTLDPLDWLEAYVLNAPLAGGVDPETVEEYDVRLVEETQLRAVAISLPADAATLARSHPEVGWAYAIDHYDAETDTADLELTFSTVVAKPDGYAVPADVLEEVDASIDDRLATNYVSKVVNATYVSIDAEGEVVPMPGWDEATVVANANAAVEAAVSPDRFLTPPYSLAPNYIPPSRIYSTDLIAAAKAADGVMHVPASAFSIGDGSAEYIELPSPAHLPQPGTINLVAA
jgi:hypothetical protein